MRIIEQIVDEIRQHHYPNPSASADELRRFEESSGYRLPADMRKFYLNCNGASLFRRPNEFPPFEILNVAALCPARVAIYGTDTDKYGPADCFAFCDRGDGDYVGIHLSHDVGELRPVIDCWHEAWPDPEYCTPIAGSFTEFVSAALDSEGKSLFWVQ